MMRRTNLDLNMVFRRADEVVGDPATKREVPDRVNALLLDILAG
jgi:hypothetical protein